MKVVLPYKTLFVKHDSALYKDNSIDDKLSSFTQRYVDKQFVQHSNWRTKSSPLHLVAINISYFFVLIHKRMQYILC